MCWSEFCCSDNGCSWEKYVAPIVSFNLRLLNRMMCGRDIERKSFFISSYYIEISYVCVFAEYVCSFHFSHIAMLKYYYVQRITHQSCTVVLKKNMWILKKAQEKIILRTVWRVNEIWNEKHTHTVFSKIYSSLMNLEKF